MKQELKDKLIAEELEKLKIQEEAKKKFEAAKLTPGKAALYGVLMMSFGIWLIWIPFVGIPIIIIGFLVTLGGLLGIAHKIMLKIPGVKIPKEITK